jgi:hypothetical protein
METEERLRKVSFAEKLTLKLVKRIPRNYASDVWYTAGDFEKFRMKVLQCEELRLRVKLKSARCHNHTRRVLLAYRANRLPRGNAATKDYLLVSSLSMESSKKPREVAVERAAKLENEIVSDQPKLNPTLSSACFGASQRWIFDYYFAHWVDGLCTLV